MCERECKCKTCWFSAHGMRCGECYDNSLSKCRSGGVKECRGYIPDTLLGYIWYRLMNIMTRRNK